MLKFLLFRQCIVSTRGQRSHGTKSDLSVLSRFRQASITMKLSLVVVQVSCRNLSLQRKMAQHLAMTEVLQIFYTRSERGEHMRCSENYLRIRVLCFNI